MGLFFGSWAHEKPHRAFRIQQICVLELRAECIAGVVQRCNRVWDCEQHPATEQSK
jgi:hypothetical protein